MCGSSQKVGGGCPKPSGRFVYWLKHVSNNPEPTTPMPRYVDGFVIPVPRKKIALYKRIARLGAKVWREHGALDYKECVMDAAPQQEGVPGDLFRKLAKTKPDETVVFAYIVYRSRAHRDRVNAKVTADPRLAPYMDPKKMPFDMSRMTFGGFNVIVSR